MAKSARIGHKGRNTKNRDVPLARYLAEIVDVEDQRCVGVSISGGCLCDPHSMRGVWNQATIRLHGVVRLLYQARFSVRTKSFVDARAERSSLSFGTVGTDRPCSYRA